jgi:dienelactone hydrolase
MPKRHEGAATAAKLPGALVSSPEAAALTWRSCILKRTGCMEGKSLRRHHPARGDAPRSAASRGFRETQKGYTITMRLSRRNFIGTGMMFATAGAIAQSLPQVPYRNYARCLPDHLRQLAAAAYEKRSKAIAGMTTREIAGGEPTKTPLNVRVTRTRNFPDYRMEFLVYESQPGVHVSANLYIPTKGQGPFPGVLFQCGHSANGKAASLYQICCQSLAKLGFLVLCFDPMGQGERTNYPGETPWLTRLNGSADDEHTLPGKQLLLVGDSSVRYQTWDAVRSLDVLASHPMVDPKRLASTGQSGGGTNTMLLAAVDDRLAVAAPCCANSENVAAREFIPPGATDDAEQDFVGSGLFGFDRWDLLYPLAPKPLLVLVSAHDFAGTYSPNYIRNGVEEFQRLRTIYERMGAADKIDWQETLLPHSVSYGLRLHTYNWLRRWLQGETKPLLEEPETSPLSDRDILVTEQGNVNIAYNGTKPGDLARKAAAASMQPPGSILEQKLRPAKPAKGLRPKRLGTTPYPRVTIEAVEVQSAEKVYVPIWIYRPRKPSAASSAKVVLLLNPAGRQGWREGEFAEKLAEAGNIVCLTDIRGVGEMAPELSGGSSRYARNHSTEQHYAWGSLVLGESLLSQRVNDILAVTEAVLNHTGAKSLSIGARGILTTAALCAATFDSRIQHLLLSGGLVSFNSILQAEEFVAGGYFLPANEVGQDVFGSFIPGILKHTDLPQIAASIAPRSIVLAGAMGAKGSTAEPTVVQQTYAVARNVSVVNRPIWGPQLTASQLFGAS